MLTFVRSEPFTIAAFNKEPPGEKLGEWKVGGGEAGCFKAGGSWLESGWWKPGLWKGVRVGVVLG
jgi:hypothetical protein